MILMMIMMIMVIIIIIMMLIMMLIMMMTNHLGYRAKHETIELEDLPVHIKMKR